MCNFKSMPTKLRTRAFGLTSLPIPPAPVVPAGQHVAPEILAAHTAWNKGSKEIVGLMLMTMEPDIQQNLETLHAHEMLLELKTLFAQQAEHELLQTTRDFHSCKQKEGQSVSSYVLKMKGYIDNLEHLGYPVTLGLGVSLILIGLRKEFDGFVQNYNMCSLEKTINELHAMLKLHEQTLPKNNAPALYSIRAGKVQKVNKHKKSQPQMAARGPNHGKGKNKQAYAPKPKIPPLPKREDLVKDSICHECGETGHWKRNCPQYLAELLKKKKNTASGASGSGIFVIELNNILNRSWIYDTGCGTHTCNTTQGLRASRKLKSGALSLYVGNGQREAVEAIGVFYLCLSSVLEIVLNNCHYAPFITIGVISVSRLYEDGFINRFMNNTIQVSRNNMVYFSAIPRDDRMCLYIDAEEHELGDLGEPANYKAALLDPESEKWLNAMNVEMQSMKDNKFWVLVELPPNGKIFGCKWLFKKKTDMDGVRYCMENSKRGSIPMQEKLKLSKSQGASTPAELKRMQIVPYASVAGSIMYAVRCTRPDVAFA
nr:zinc finger, CCHC-type [Tanacetum cinerariifolium]